MNAAHLVAIIAVFTNPVLAMVMVVVMVVVVMVVVVVIMAYLHPSV